MLGDKHAEAQFAVSDKHKEHPLPSIPLYRKKEFSVGTERACKDD